MALEARRQKILRKVKEKIEGWHGKNPGNEGTGDTGPAANGRQLQVD